MSSRNCAARVVAKGAAFGVRARESGGCGRAGALGVVAASSPKTGKTTKTTITKG